MKLSPYHNQQFWNKFDPVVYVRDYYSRIISEDRHTIIIYEKFFRMHPKVEKAAEIGVGPNLYPLMTALPYVDQYEAIDFSQSNIRYLKKQLKKPSQSWYRFWNLLKRLNNRYQIDLVKNLHRKVTVIHGDIYKLSGGKYDLAVMQTCAESITNKYSEFKKACQKFVNCVKHGGFLLATFSENSEGYSISGISFPACKVDKKKLMQIFQSKTRDLKISRIPKVGKGYKKEGYTGILVLTARRI